MQQLYASEDTIKPTTNSNQQRPSKSRDKENFYDIANKQTIENEITEKPVFGRVIIPEYSSFQGNENQLVVSSYAKAIDKIDNEYKCLKDLSYEIVPSDVSLKIINQEGKKKEVYSQRETENEKVSF